VIGILAMQMRLMGFGSNIGMVDGNSGDENAHDGVWVKNWYC